MDPHDLVLSKLGAGREKDFDFVRSTARLGLVRREELLVRLEMVACSDEQRLQIAARINAPFSSREPPTVLVYPWTKRACQG